MNKIATQAMLVGFGFGFGYFGSKALNYLTPTAPAPKEQASTVITYDDKGRSIQYGGKPGLADIYLSCDDKFPIGIEEKTQ